MASVESATLTKVTQGQYLLQGVMSLATLASLLREPIESVSGEASVDLSGLLDSDSSAAALMVHWSRRAASNGESIRYEGCPKKLMALLDLYDLPPVLGIA